MNDMFILVLWSVLTIMTAAQRPVSNTNACTLTPSRARMTMFNVHCRCNQTLQQNVTLIDELRIDMSDCPHFTALDIDWAALEDGIKPQRIAFVGVEIILRSSTSGQNWGSQILAVEFDRCSFNKIPGRAFEGLQSLQELRFISTYIDSMEGYAISNLNQLKTLEFDESIINEVSSYAISGLTNLYELSFSKSSIGKLKTGAIHILLENAPPVDPGCPNIDIRTQNPERDARLVSDIVSRSKQNPQNMALPESGGRFLIFGSNITHMENKAIESSIFAFIVIVGSDIVRVSESAIRAELHNQCEISAVVIVGNTIQYLENGAFAFINGRLRATHKTYFVLSGNTFLHVARNGFLLHPQIEINKVDSNFFYCNCTYLGWLQDMSSNSRQEELKKHLILDAQCNGNNVKVAHFASSCTSFGGGDHDLPGMGHHHGGIPTSTGSQPDRSFACMTVLRVVVALVVRRLL